MDKEDAAKTSFIMDCCVFAYRKMLFRIKSVGATYQRMVDKIFQCHISKEVEVYVDDIVIKSEGKSTSISDLRTV